MKKITEEREKQIKKKEVKEKSDHQSNYQKYGLTCKGKNNTETVYSEQGHCNYFAFQIVSFNIE